MKKINVTVICPGEEEYPGCVDLLRTYPEINLVACYYALEGPGLRVALDSSDVLLLDEAVLAVEGPEKVRAIHTDYPGMRILQIVENNCEISTMIAIYLGVRGMIERASMVSTLRKAITVMYSGETWMSRGMVQLLHNRSRFLADNSVWLTTPVSQPGWDKLN